MHDIYDFLVIGAGSGGVAAARRAGAFGARVALCEEKEVGGTCVHRGCIPKKLMVYASHFPEDFEMARCYGWDAGEPSFDFGRLQQAIRRELHRLEGVYLTMLETSRVDLYRGRARFVDAETVECDGKRLRARHILIATGARPWVPDLPNVDLGVVSDDLFKLDTLPRRILIIGSGYIGSEFASIFDAFGCEVTQIFRSKAMLPGFDDDVRQILMESMKERGIRIIPEATVEGATRKDDGVCVVTSEMQEIEVDLVLSATGRVPNTAGLGLDVAGVETRESGAIVVDEESRTNVPHLYAIGDVTQRVQLTPVAIAEGRALVETLFHDNPMRVSYDLIPKAVFTLPMVGSVGLTEMEARTRGHDVRIFRTRFRPMKYSLTSKTERVLMKLVVDGATDRVLGAHMVSGDAPEVIQAVAVALEAGATKAVFDRTMALHPTAAEEFVLMYEPVQEPKAMAT